MRLATAEDAKACGSAEDVIRHIRPGAAVIVGPGNSEPVTSWTRSKPRTAAGTA